ncbi:Imm21 family immunity protein [Streptomyces sp. NPDC051217]|uniref:Imm21 family immunity protein n=1 Tax=Streptomyces sp. NPDC051217 TaxID=3365644 RepID=UPI0037979F41
MSVTPHADPPRHPLLDPNWVTSMGGPLVVLPVSALRDWAGCTESGMVIGDTDTPDDSDRACAVEDFAAVIDVGTGDAQALVLGDEPAKTCFLPDRNIFIRWLAADSYAELLPAAETLLADPATPWKHGAVWETDGESVLMDSAEAGDDLGQPYPHNMQLPEQAPADVPAGRWRIRAFHKTGEFPWVGVVQLIPEQTPGAATLTENTTLASLGPWTVSYVVRRFSARCGSAPLVGDYRSRVGSSRS